MQLKDDLPRFPVAGATPVTTSGMIGCRHVLQLPKTGKWRRVRSPILSTGATLETSLLWEVVVASRTDGNVDIGLQFFKPPVGAMTNYRVAVDMTTVVAIEEKPKSSSSTAPLPPWTIVSKGPMAMWTCLRPVLVDMPDKPRLDCELDDNGKHQEGLAALPLANPSAGSNQGIYFLPLDQAEKFEYKPMVVDVQFVPGRTQPGQPCSFYQVWDSSTTLLAIGVNPLACTSDQRIVLLYKINYAIERSDVTMSAQVVLGASHCANAEKQLSETLLKKLRSSTISVGGSRGQPCMRTRKCYSADEDIPSEVLKEMQADGLVCLRARVPKSLGRDSKHVTSSSSSAAGGDSKDVRSLDDSEETGTVAVATGDVYVDVFVHSAVLCAQSSVMSAAFAHALAETQKRWMVVAPQFSIKTVGDAIRFMYGVDIPNCAFDGAKELLEFAHLYDLWALYETSARRMFVVMDHSNVVTVCNTLVLYPPPVAESMIVQRTNELMDRCFSYIRANQDRVAHSQAPVDSLRHPLVSALLASPTHSYGSFMAALDARARTTVSTDSPLSKGSKRKPDGPADTNAAKRPTGPLPST